MNQKELKELIEFLIEKDIAEFELERGDVKVRIKRGGEAVASASAPDTRFFTVHAAPTAAPEAGTAPVPGTVAPPVAAKAPAPEGGGTSRRGAGGPPARRLWRGCSGRHRGARARG